MRLFIVIFLFFINIAGKAQITIQSPKNYTEAIKKGKFELEKGNYNYAIDLFLAAQAFEPSKRDSVRYFLNEAFERINRLKNEAVISKKEAIINLQKADSLLNVANISKNLAEKEKQNAIAEKEKAKEALNQTLFLQKKIIISILDKAVRKVNAKWKGFNAYFWNNADSEGYQILDEIDTLDLSNSGLAKIPEKVLLFRNLKFLNLLGNDISWKESSKILDKINQNTNIYISLNSIDEISKNNWKKITGIELLSKKLKSIPKEILYNKQLTYFSIKQDQSNKIKVLPDEFYNLINLKHLSLERCGLREISSKIENLSQLKELNLSENYKLKIPIELFNLKKLEFLDLNHCTLNTIPSQIGKLTNLKELNLSGNYVGTVPPELSKLKKIRKLKLSWTALKELPYKLKSLNNLSVLYLDNNKLSSIPKVIFKFSRLKKLYLGGNQINNIPSDISKLISLEKIELYDNLLDTLPNEFGLLTKLRIIKLANNKFFTFPSVLCKLINLYRLEISSNHIRTIPNCIENLKDLSVLDLNRNEIVSLPNTIGKLIKLRYLSLRHNKLNLIPNNFYNLSNLQFLDLRDNNLSSLPNGISKLSKLKTIGLSNNPILTLPNDIYNLSELSEKDGIFVDFSNFSDDESYMLITMLSNKSLIGLIDFLGKEKKYKAAIKILTKILRIKKLPIFYHNIIYYGLITNNTDITIKYSKELIKLFPDDTIVYNYLFFAFLNSESPEINKASKIFNNWNSKQFKYYDKKMNIKYIQAKKVFLETYKDLIKKKILNNEMLFERFFK